MSRHQLRDNLYRHHAQQRHGFTGQGTPDIGVTLQDAARPGAGDIISGNRIDFTSGAFNNQSDSRRKEFMATLFWLKNPPQPGAFSIPVNATVTFK